MKLPRKYLVALLLLVIPGTVGGHHATALQFDVSRTIKLTGVISKLDWANPHVHLSLDVKVANAVAELWDVELASPGGVIVTGLSKDLLKLGTTISITGYPAKTKRTVCAKELTLADGTTATFVVGI